MTNDLNLGITDLEALDAPDDRHRDIGIAIGILIGVLIVVLT